MKVDYDGNLQTCHLGLRIKKCVFYVAQALAAAASSTSVDGADHFLLRQDDVLQLVCLPMLCFDLTFLKSMCEPDNDYLIFLVDFFYMLHSAACRFRNWFRED